MTKRQLIDEIITINHTAKPGFLARFEEKQLNEYLQHLEAVRAPRLSGDASRYDKYFANTPTIAAPKSAGPPRRASGPKARIRKDNASGRQDGGASKYFSPDADDEQTPVVGAEQFEDRSAEPTAVGVAASSKQNTQSPFADAQEDSESWLF